jgi:hypothetical protein
MKTKYTYTACIEQRNIPPKCGQWVRGKSEHVRQSHRIQNAGVRGRRRIQISLAVHVNQPQPLHLAAGGSHQADADRTVAADENYDLPA